MLNSVTTSMHMTKLAYSHTFPNKSSLPPPNPPAAGLLLFTPPALVATGLAWLHPPNSSSCCTLKPPGLDGFAGEAGSPQPESNGVCIDGGAGLNALALFVCIGGGWAGCDGASGVAQASFEPQASMLLRLEKLDACGKGGDAGAAGLRGCAERLKALLEV